VLIHSIHKFDERTPNTPGAPPCHHKWQKGLGEVAWQIVADILAAITQFMIDGNTWPVLVAAGRLTISSSRLGRRRNLCDLREKKVEGEYLHFPMRSNI
jgi:hypothetical protein